MRYSQILTDREKQGSDILYSTSGNIPESNALVIKVQFVKSACPLCKEKTRKTSRDVKSDNLTKNVRNRDTDVDAVYLYLFDI